MAPCMKNFEERTITRGRLHTSKLFSFGARRGGGGDLFFGGRV